ncbi:hypothetical protein CY35_04G114200 [Sphagnum magellanicum]|nr:hypothetical protein CY35_04G114200 [Sphagnum magellanicum]KAH9566135.1 hypothetical protein CY35_04G114200 [Sphagnum magellanicum]KAH9566136.1 hypothetical protein CY35_04G114200 [Sphagnum magellanicum]
MQNQVVGPGSGRHMALIAGKSAAFKEKFVSLYEDVFALRSVLQTAKDQGIQGHTAIARFWDELLLLKVNEAFLSRCISQASEEQLRGNLQPVINDIFATCVRYLNDGNFIRVAHALETLAILLREIFKKRFNEQGFTILILVAGSVDNADNFFRRLIMGIVGLLTRDDVPVLVKSLGVKVYLTILTATHNVNTNPIASYLFIYNVFDALVAVSNLKLAGERSRVELDATLVLILLLLWRESSNPYAERILSPVSPILPLLHTVASLLSPLNNVTPTDFTSSLSSLSLTRSDGSVFGYIGSLFGYGATHQDTSRNVVSGITGPETLDTEWCNTTAGLLLLYFLFYLNPMLKSAQVWPSSNFNTVQGVGVPGQSVTLLWMEVLRSFFSISKEIISQLATSGVSGVLRAKLCLTILRCLVEDRVASDFLSQCDSRTFMADQVSSNGLTGIPVVIQFKSVTSLIVELGANVLALKPIAPHLDPDLFYRAAILVPIVFNSLKVRGFQLSSSSMNFFALWDALLKTCEWCGDEKAFQRPGVPELAGLTLGIIEMSLGSNPEIWAAPDETERLHAMVMAHIMSLEHLVQTAAKSVVRSHIQLVNVAAVKYHYEVQIAGLGVRGQATMEQALVGVRKKGIANLKLKSVHTGPGHSYMEGMVELGLLTNLARSLLIEHRKQSSIGMPKLELEAT